MKRKKCFKMKGHAYMKQKHIKKESASYEIIGQH